VIPEGGHLAQHGEQPLGLAIRQMTAEMTLDAAGVDR
jgi:hypothetical protein